MEEGLKEYEFLVEVDKVFGENFYLKPRCSGGRAHLYMTPDAKKYKKFLIEGLKEQVEKTGFPWGKVFPKKVSYTFIIGRDRDVGNMIKVTEDALSEAIGVDDSVWEEIQAKKVVVSDLQKEVVIIKLSF